MIVAFGADHAGFDYKRKLIEQANVLSFQALDCGVFSEEPADYPDIAFLVVQEVLAGRADCAVLICGTGIGMSIAANRQKGIRAAVCNEGPRSAFYARAHNDANILCLGARLLTLPMAFETLQTFLTTPFEEGRHQERIRKLDERGA